MIDNKLQFLPAGSAKYNGKPDEYARFIIERQLKDEKTWEKFVNVFGSAADIHDNGWRGEYWGKMMRGACLVYGYTKDASLYSVLENAVRGLLTRQDSLGRISTYDVEHEFCGWDMWSRKYVLTGLQHFYDISRDEALKADIIKAMIAHADYIVSRIGNEKDGKKEITKTSNFWLGVNSCTILEPIVRLYTMTGDKKYLDFAQYIISTGGIDHEENLIELAYKNEIPPYKYPETKAYETMSFFEGVLAYYCATGEQKLLTAVTNFVEAVAKTDITIIGCSGCTHELFDNSANVQTEYSEIIMQETCVTVTWMRLNARLALLTGKAIYAERIEHSAYNALFGSINTQNCRMYSRSDKTCSLEPMPFDSYSPLYNNSRNKGVGGYKVFADGTYYGCCICIAAAGLGLLPLIAATKSTGGLCINSLMDGKISIDGMTFTAKTSYPKEASYTLTADCDIPEDFEVKIRIPEGVENISVHFCGEEIVSESRGEAMSNGYIVITGAWRKGNSLVFSAEAPLALHSLNGKIAFTKGVLVLARDSKKEPQPVDFTAEVALDKSHAALEITPQNGEMFRIAVMLDNKMPLLLTDYASCGKKWDDEDGGNLMTVWMNAKV